MYRTAVYCGTRNCYSRMVTAAKSLVWHTQMDRIYFLIEDDRFPYWVPEMVQTLNVSGQPWFRRDGANAGDHRSYMNLLRLALPKILTEPVVLSMDNDTVVVDDISPLLETDLGEYYFAGVREPAKSRRGPYINTGDSLHNLKALRESGMVDTLITAVNAKRYECPMQDSIYEFCNGKILTVDGCYNASNYTETSAEPVRVFHFAADPEYERNQLWRNYAAAEWRIKCGS